MVGVKRRCDPTCRHPRWRVTQYFKTGAVLSLPPRRTGSSAFAEDDGLLWCGTVSITNVTRPVNPLETIMGDQWANS